MGGNLALGYVLSGRPAPDVLVLSAPSIGGGVGWQRALAAVASKIAPTTTVASGFKGEQLSRDPAVGEVYSSDPLVYPKSTTRLWQALFNSMRDLNENAGKLDVPTLVLHGGADTMVPPQSTAILGELPTVERRLLPNLRHEILNEPEGPELVQDIIDWIDARI